METDSDAGLLRRFVADRSEAAFVELVNRHLGRVYGVALRKVGGDSHLAQDVAQTVFVSLSRKAATLAQREVIGGWLYRATHLAAVEALRTRRRRQARELEAHIMNQSNEASVDRQELRCLLDEVLHELGDADRDAVWLRFFEGRAFAHIGERLQVSENAARMRVDRALEKLSALLAQRGITSTASAVGLALADQAFAEVPAGFGGQVVAGGIAASGTSASSGLGALFMANLKLVGGAALLGGLLAVSLTVAEQRKAPREAAAKSDPTAMARAAALMRRNAPMEVQAQTLAASPPPVAAPPVPAVTKPAVRLNGQGITVTSTPMQTKIRNNLRQIAAARNLFLRDNGRLPVSLDELVGATKNIRELVAVNDEDYSGLNFGASKLAVTAADGIEVVLEDAAPKASGPPNGRETAQWEAELAAYAPLALAADQPLRIRNEYDVALIAIAEVMKREGWDSGISIFRPEKIRPTDSTWDAQLNHLVYFLQDGKKMVAGTFVQMSISDDGKIVTYNARKPNIVSLE